MTLGGAKKFGKNGAKGVEKLLGTGRQLR